MKIPAVLNSRPVMIAAGVAVGALVLYLIGRKVAGAVSSAVTNINRGTPYQGTGVVGTLGNAANQASGGILAEFGGWLGRTIYDVTHSDPK